MTDERHPVDDALRRLAGDPEPTEQDRELAEARLAAAIDERAAVKLRLRRRRPIWAYGVLAVLTVVFVVVQLARPSPTAAAIKEIARAAEQTSPLEIPDQTYAYTKSNITALRVVPAERLHEVGFDRDFLSYLLPVERETWVGSDGTMQIRTTIEAPLFFSPDDEAIYYQAELDQDDAIGKTTTDTFTPQDVVETWPTDLETLDQAIRAAMGDQGRPTAVEYLDVALDILRETLIEPSLRANTLRLISDLPGLTLLASDANTTTLGIEYPDQGIDTRLLVTLSPDGYLLGEESMSLQENPTFGIPADTTTSSASYTIPRLVEYLPTS